MVKVASLRLGIDPTGAEAGARRFQTAAGKVTASAKTAALGVGNMVGAMAAFAGIGGTIRTIAGFENRIAVLGKVAQASDKQLAALTERARELGAQTRFSGEEAAEGLLQLARAGFTVDEQLAAIKDTLDLATAAELDLAEASGFVSNTIRQFNLDASEAGRVADAFTVASNNANTDVRQLAEAMAYAGTIAGTLGLSVEQTAGFIGVLGNAGIQASMAGTNLRGVLLALSSTTEKAEKALGKMGLTYDEVNPATNDAIQIFENLRRGFSNLENPAEAAGIATEIFGRRNAAAAVTMSQNVDIVEELTQKQIESEAAHAEVARTLEQTLIGKFTALKSAMSEVMLVTGDGGLTGALKGAVVTLTEVAQVIGGVEGAMAKASFQAKALLAVMTALAARAVVSGLTAVAGAFLTMAANIRNAATAGALLQSSFVPIVGLVALLGFQMDQARRRTSEFESSVIDVKEAIERLQQTQEMQEQGFLFSIDAAGNWKTLNHELATSETRIEALRAAITVLESDQPLKAGLLEGLGLEGLKTYDVTTKGRELGGQFAGFRTDDTTTSYYNKEVALAAAQAALAAEEKAAEEAAANEFLNKQKALLNDVNEALRTGTKELETQKDYSFDIAKGAEDRRNSLQDQVDILQAMASGNERQARFLAEMQRLEGGTIQQTVQNMALIAQKLDLEDKIAAQKQAQRDAAAAERDALSDALAIERQRAQVEAGVRSFEKRIAQMQFLRDNIGLTADEYEKLAAVEQIKLERDELLKNADEQQAATIRSVTDELIAQQEALGDLEDKREMTLEFRNAFVDMFSNIITGSMSAADAFEQFAQRMLSMMTEMILKKALMDAFFNQGTSADPNGNVEYQMGNVAGQARGGYFDGGRRFARGGIVSSPTNFLYSGGLGVMGEAGPEAIMPIGRNSKGEVGVKIAGGAHQRPNVTVNMTVNASDANSFRKSRVQIQEDLKRMTTKIDRI